MQPFKWTLSLNSDSTTSVLTYFTLCNTYFNDLLFVVPFEWKKKLVLNKYYIETIRLLFYL